ncbi:Uncharacterized protein Rs2_52315 [Raphanus sativus]|nr:Uncharacterized protein Rs2_52315 [Raphanus sativus]
MEPAQHGVQDVLNFPTEVHVFHHTGQTDRAVFWSVLHASGRELWLEPWPDDRLDHTGLCLPRADFHFMINGQDIVTFRRTNSVSVHRHSFLDYIPHVPPERPDWSSVLNHDLEMDLIDLLHFFPSQFNILRLIVMPDSTWDEKSSKMFTDFLLWSFWCVLRARKAVLTSLLQFSTH